jgi:AbrB family looped-hinge helix DNA binding protein
MGSSPHERCAAGACVKLLLYRYYQKRNMRLTSKGQVTIPQNIRELAGLKPYDEVEFEYRNKQIVVKPVKRTTTPAEEAIALLRGSATSKLDLSADEWLEMTRGER